MKFAIAFAAVLAVSSAQFPGFRPPQRYSPFPAPSPTFLPFPSSTPLPPRPTQPTLASVNRVSNDQNAQIVRYENDIGPDGSFRYAFETDNGIAAQADGTPRAFGGNPPESAVVSAGSFSWYSPEGQLNAISYIADENGYQPQGDIIPTPHPIPPAILRALEYIARNPKPQQK